MQNANYIKRKKEKERDSKVIFNFTISFCIKINVCIYQVAYQIPHEHVHAPEEGLQRRLVLRGEPIDKTPLIRGTAATSFVSLFMKKCQIPLPLHVVAVQKKIKKLLAK